MFLPIAVVMLGPSVRLLHLHHFGYVCTTEVMENSKYLGVTINNKLNWIQHITNIKGKASRTLDFLQRNLRGCKSNVKSTAYTTMVRPTLEYAGTAFPISGGSWKER
jgi:hypothetical protein